LQNTRHFFNIVLCLISNGYKNTQFEKFYQYVVSYPHLGNSGNILQKNSREASIFSAIEATRLSFYLNSLLVNPLKSFTGYYSTLNLSTIKPVNHSTKSRPVAFRLPMARDLAFSYCFFG